MLLEKVENNPGSTNDSELVWAVRQRLAREPGAHVTVKQLAEELGVTQRQLSAAFGRSLGVSVAVYLRRERMYIAERLLLQTSMPIQDISEELGFSCPANFSSSFRAHSGMPPSEFRNSPPDHLAFTTIRDIKWGLWQV